jgi:RHS repeat-associated protein
MLVLLLTLLVGHAYSQDTTSNPLDGYTPSGLAPGAPVGSYALSGFDTINPYSGGMSFNLPLLSIRGRGSADYTIRLPIEQKWSVNHSTADDGQGRHYDFYDAEFNAFILGTRAGYGPGALYGRQVASNYQYCDYAGSFLPTRTLTRFTFATPDGTEYELHDVQTDGNPFYVGTCAFNGTSRGKVFKTADGSAATFISDQPVVDQIFIYSGVIGGSGYLFLRDGTRYRIDGGTVTWMTDRNGNKLTFEYNNFALVSSIKDSLNREVAIEYNVNDVAPYGLCDRITYKGFDGATRIIRVSYDSLANVLRAGFSVQNSQNCFPELNNASSYSACTGGALVSAVWLPERPDHSDRRSYKFYYNNYSELARVELPTGGAFEYDWAGGYNNGPTSGAVCFDCSIYRRVTERRVYSDGVNLESQMSISKPDTLSGGAVQSNSFVETDEYDSANRLMNSVRHYYFGHAWQSMLPNDPVGYPDWHDGREYQTETLDSNGSTVLRRTTSAWDATAPTSQFGPGNNPRITETDTTLEPGGANQTSRQTFSYDQYANKTDIYEYDYTGGLLRHSHTDYLTTNGLNGIAYDTVNPNTSSPNASVTIHLRSLPVQQSIYDGGGVERARTRFEYDNYNADTNHAALQTYPRPGFSELPISGLDAAFNSSSNNLTRGNVTGTTRYLLTNDLVTGSITSYSQYDVAGNVLKAIDARGYATTVDFSDRFGVPDGEARSNAGSLDLNSAVQYGYAFPTLITNALGHTAYAQFDYYTGKPVDGEDANGIVSSGYCDDPLDRPTKVILGANQGPDVKSQNIFSYDDTNRVVTVTTDQNAFNDDHPIKSQTVYDGLGRTTEKRQYETATDYITVLQTYDALGRSYKTSNPFRASEAILWTTTSYDALSRVTSITTPDGSVVATSYSANTATVTDQAGKARKSVSDALGRLIQVYDDPSNLNYLTSYSYDALDDLTNVYQGNQNRSFVYDSLKRHTLASNPENGTVNYQYDENGNLKIKTDARGIISTYDYDALNRNQGVTYTNDSAGSPAVTRTYDGATHGIGKPWKTQTVGSTGTLTIIDSYDALGRPLVSRQQFYTGSGWGQPFTETLTYNQAGHIVTDTYPSGRIVTNSYDGAGRTISVTGSLGDGTQRTYSTGIIYSPFGTLAKEQFGTVAPIYNKLFYNVRGQLAEIREGTTYTGPTDTNSARGAIVNNYSLQAGCVGASCSATDNDGNLMRQDVYIPGSSVFSQFYGYDSLNRLQSVREDGPLGSGNWQQAYTYDQYGNRKINSAATWGNDVNNMQAAVDPNTTTNRMYAPGETDQNHSLIDYDNAGNQKKDYYSYSANGIVFDRTYDAENRIKNSAATYSSPASTQTSTYTYDGDGRRVKRNIGNTETWQVYGIGGELLAEYAPNTAPSTPQKEYGYRSGQLLISATAPAGLAMNKASDIHENAVASAPPAFGAESATAAQSVDLLASIKELILPLSGVRNVTTARTEAVSDTATPLYGPSFPYAASLNRSAFPLMPQSGSAKIAFASNRDGSAQIYSMNTDGGGLSRLTNDAANDEAPNWSPNNSRIVFQSDRDNLFSGISDIYVMNWDGSGQTRLTSDAADDSAAVWSPDGTRIVFQSARNGASYQVYVMNADGSGQANISNSAANDTQPSWSPDGSKIAFASDRDQAGFSSIYVMNANGTNQTRLTISGVGVLDNQPVWSPDGTKLTFTSTRDSIVQTWTETDDDGGTVTKSALHVNKEVYVMNANGSAQVRLTTTLENDDSASWSGDGTKIVFRSDRERDCCDPMEQVWVMNPDGTSQLDLSNNGLDDHCPSWQRVANVPPTVSLTSPANGATLIAPANIAVTASASDSDGSVSRVDFYQGVTLIGTATTSPYTVTWNNVAAGSYSLTARATDNLGATSTSAAVTITVNANVPPAVNITSPSSGAVFTAPANITVTANASDSDGTVSRVDFYQGATLIGTSMTSPYTISWNSVAAGSYALTARATDNLGATTTSAPVNITVNAPPAVSITSPTNGATFTAPSNITVTAIASDSDGSISRVDFYQGTTLLGTATTSPYTIAWNNVAAGGYTLTARATDNLGATTTSNSVNITVGSPPTVSLTTPTNGTSFTATANVTITATASASNGSINRVEFYQGSSLIGTSTASPYTISWNNVAAGSYTLKARAIDNSGVSTDSNPVSITVNAPPAVSIATPANGASFTAPVNISITANATDSDGSISHVDLYNGTTLIGTATSSPYSYVWNNVSAGTYSITAKATDNLGAQTSSTVVNITVNAPPPAVADIRWIVTDQLGTPRMIFDQTGALAGVSRHDYLPFGEELYAGGRTTNLGYGAAGDNVRQRYTGKERDIETGLDYFKARYYSSVQGRFASADAPFADQQTADPSSWNMYSYVRNSPCSRIDPDGRCSPPPGLKEGQVGICIEAFIAAKTFKMFGAGNGRGFNGNDEKLTSKFSISIIGERTRGNSKNFNITQKTTAGLTYLVEPYTGIQISPAVQGTANSKLNSGQSHSNSPALEPYNSDGSTAITIPIDRGGMARFNISTKAENGVADFIDLGSIRSSLNLSVNANTGQVRLEEGSKATGYPSFAVYSYVYNGKNIVTNTVRQIPEGRPEALTKPMKPIQQ